MFNPYVHNIDPVIATVFGVHLWWYGASFTLGFLNLNFFCRRFRGSIGLSAKAVYVLSILVALGILTGGRTLVVVNNEWEFYREHITLIPAIWVGGFASHGLILGGGVAVIVFCTIYKADFRRILDLLAISAAMVLGFGRIGNFIDGQIFGSLTEMPWGVHFPSAEGFRHPVVLYDGLKNFLLVPLLLWLRARDLPPGRITAVFLILYAGLRIPIDLLREYPTTMWSLPNGQMLNILMVGLGLFALGINFYRNRNVAGPGTNPSMKEKPAPPILKLVFAVLCILPLVIPSDATRDVPATYGSRHPGIRHSPMYPDIAKPLTDAENEKEHRISQ